MAARSWANSTNNGPDFLPHWPHHQDAGSCGRNQSGMTNRFLRDNPVTYQLVHGNHLTSWRKIAYSCACPDEVTGSSCSPFKQDDDHDNDAPPQVTRYGQNHQKGQSRYFTTCQAKLFGRSLVMTWSQKDLSDSAITSSIHEYTWKCMEADPELIFNEKSSNPRNNPPGILNLSISKLEEFIEISRRIRSATSLREKLGQNLHRTKRKRDTRAGKETRLCRGFLPMTRLPKEIGKRMLKECRVQNSVRPCLEKRGCNRCRDGNQKKY